MPLFAVSLLLPALLGPSLRAGLPDSAQDDHEYRLQSVRWDLSIDFPNGAIAGAVTNTVVPTRDGAALVFDCCNLDVSKVEVDGTVAGVQTNGKVIVVQPASPLAKGKPAAVTISYSGKPEAGIYFVPAARTYPAHTDIVYTQGEMVDNRYWLPTYDEPDDKATFEGTIHVPAGWKALSNGYLVDVKHEGATDAWHWKLDQPCSTYLISLVAGPYDIVPDGNDPVPVSFWVPEGLDEWGRAAFGGTDKIVRFYSKLTGVPFPWPKYSQSAVADFMFGGMENVTCTTQTITALHPFSVEPNVDTTGLVAHELAHQWFGDLVTLKDWSHTWLNEGWASFLPNFWDREKYGQEAYDLDRLGVFNGGVSAHQGRTDRGVVWTGYQEPIDMFDNFAYPGGASRMFMLMHAVGEDRFWPAITAYLNTYRYKNATTDDFFNSLSKSLGVDLRGFEKQWFYTPAAPTLTVKRDGNDVTIQQGPVPFELPLDVLLVNPDGSVEKRHVTLPATSSTDITDVNGRLVLIDPEVWLMAEISYDTGYTPADWRQLYQLAPNAAEKERIIDDPKAFGAFDLQEKVSLARNERSVRLLEKMIPQIPDEEFLLDMSQMADTRLIAAAAEEMAHLKADRHVTERLRDLWTSSPNDVVKNDALASLLVLTSDPALADQAYATDSYDERIRKTALDWWEVHVPDKAREVSLAALAGNASEPIKLEAISVLGRVKDRPGEHKVYEVLASYMGERSNSTLRAAINALADYGDPAAIPLIEKRANHGLTFVRADVRRALQTLRR